MSYTSVLDDDREIEYESEIDHMNPSSIMWFDWIQNLRDKFNEHKMQLMDSPHQQPNAYPELLFEWTTINGVVLKKKIGHQNWLIFSI